DYGSANPGANRIGPERWSHGPLFKVLDPGRQSARAQHHGLIFDFLIGEAARNNSLVVNWLIDSGNALDFAVQDHPQQVFHVCGGEGEKLASALSGKSETYSRLAILIARRLGASQVFAGNSRNTRDKIPSLAAVWGGLSRHQH